MLPELLFTELHGLSMVMLILPEISIILWLWEQLHGLGVAGS